MIISEKRQHNKPVWYVLRVETGKERIMQKELEKSVDGVVIKELCVPRNQLKRKFRGQWRTVEAPLFPGYMFVQTRNVMELHNVLRKTYGLIYILKNDEGFLPLDEKGLRFLKAFSVFDKEVIEFSEGYIEGQQVYITKGPLMGQTAYIAKINRHKRIAFLKISMCGRDVSVKVGLEIITKKD